MKNCREIKINKVNAINAETSYVGLCHSKNEKGNYLKTCRNCKHPEKFSCPLFQKHKREVLELVRSAQNNNDSAMETLIKKYGRFVYQAEKKYFIPGADSEDLCQEGFIGLFMAVKTYREDSPLSFEDYLSLSIRNYILRAVRHATQKKQLVLTKAQYVDNEVLTGILGVSREDTEDIVLSKFYEEKIQNFIRYFLSEAELKVIKLSMAGFIVDEVAEIIGRDRKYVENTLYRSRKKIREYIQENESPRAQCIAV